jgi:TetR/AcrR family transcriptional regulator, regulator of cefoperazone and chloramphenicol sensitivity
MTAKAQARGPYRAGEETRRALLDAALRQFGRDGYEATATRAVCAEAGVAIPAIAYHFGNKEGLYLACADDVIARYRDRMGPALAAVVAALPAMPPGTAREALWEIVALLLAMVRDTGEDAPWLAFMLGEMSRPGAAHDRLAEQLWLPGVALVAQLIARVRGVDESPAERGDALLMLSGISALTTSRRISEAFIGGDPVETLGARLQRWISRL